MVVLFCISDVDEECEADLVFERSSLSRSSKSPDRISSKTPRSDRKISSGYFWFLVILFYWMFFCNFIYVFFFYCFYVLLLHNLFARCVCYCYCTFYVVLYFCVWFLGKLDGSTSSDLYLEATGRRRSSGKVFFLFP